MTYLNECIIYAIYYAEQSLIISRHLKVFENKGCKLQAQRGVLSKTTIHSCTACTNINLVFKTRIQLAPSGDCANSQTKH